MRLWSLHPQYLDAKGLTALWREGLLALHVLQGRTKGYRFHPQLERFKGTPDPVQIIQVYLAAVLAEADARGYHYDCSKIQILEHKMSLTVTDGQLAYEWQFLLQKLQCRDPQRWEQLKSINRPLAHPLFQIIPGSVASWEKVPEKAGSV